MAAIHMASMIVGIIGAFAAVAAAVFWAWASIIKVPDNIDTFIRVLKRIGRLNAYAASCAVVAALCAAYGFASAT